MTLIFFVEEQTMRQRVPGCNSPPFPVGLAADGRLIDNNDTEVAVLLVDDLANPKGDYQVRLELTQPVMAVLHRPNIAWQSRWLESIGAISFEELSHKPGNPAYEQVNALLSAGADDERASICKGICDAYGSKALVSKLEELAAWLALPDLSSDESSDADSVYDAVLALRPMLSREAAAIFQRRDGSFKALTELAVEDLENAAAVLVP